MLSAYPAITPAEFEEIGKTLEQAHAASPETADWVEVRWTGNELRIRRKQAMLDGSSSPAPGLAAAKEDEEPDEMEQDDEELLKRRLFETSTSIFVDYSLILSPTYQVPVLWLNSPSISITRVDALDQVYEHIVSPTSRTGLRQVGVLGGISMAEHPGNGLPAFFIHPCRTRETLELVRPDRTISPIEYMMLWVGIIGSQVGLSVPSEIAKSLLQEAGE